MHARSYPSILQSSPTMIAVKSSILLLILVSICGTALAGFYNDKVDRVVSINPKNYVKYFEKEPLVVLAEFYAPWCGHCQKLTPAYKAAAKKLDGLAKVVAVNCDEEVNKPLCGQYRIQGFPTIKLFKTVFDKAGKVKKFPVDYQGERSAKGLVDATLAAMPSRVKSLKANKTLNEDASAAILVPRTAAVPPLWKALSLKFPAIQFAAISASDVENLKRYLPNLPADYKPPMVYFTESYRKSGPDFVSYSGKLKLGDLSSFFKGKFDTSSNSGSARETGSVNESAPPLSAHEVSALSTESGFKDQCLQAPGICVVAFLTLEEEYPESLQQFNKSVAVLESVQRAEDKQQTQSLFHLHYVNVLTTGNQLATDLKVPTVYPTAVAIQAKKRRYVPLRGPFDEQGLLSWLNSIKSGSLASVAYTMDLRLNKPSTTNSDEL